MKTKEMGRTTKTVDAILAATISHLDALAFGFNVCWEVADGDRLTTLRKSTAGRSLSMLCGILDGGACDPAEYIDLVNTVRSDFWGVECDELTELLRVAMLVFSRLSSAPLGSVSVVQAVAAVRRQPVLLAGAAVPGE